MKNAKLKIIAALLLLMPNLAHGAEFYFGAPAEEVGVGTTVEVGVFLNTDGELVNAFEGVIQIPQKYFTLKEIRSGGTVVSMWIEKPHWQDNAVRFSGIIPGGYVGGRGYLFSAILEARAVGEALIETRSEQILLHDGQGTPVSMRRAPARFKIVSVSEGPGFVPSSDVEPPEDFVPQIGWNASLFDNKWFVAFGTQDKGSGVDHYVIHESRRMKERIATNEWIAAESPYVLQDQKLRSFVQVKAVDKAGNERIAIVAPRYPLPWYAKPEVWGILVVVFLVLYALGRILWRQKHKVGH